MVYITSLFGTRSSLLIRSIFSARHNSILRAASQVNYCKYVTSCSILFKVNCSRNFQTSATFGNSIHENPRNHKIKAKSVLLIDSHGEKLGTMTFEQALSKAKDNSLQLVQLQNQRGLSPAICKLVSSKTLYESEKKAKHNTQGFKIKELKITGRIAPQDLQWKSKKIYDFLEHGYIVKLSVTCKPYQKISNAEKMDIVARIKEDVKDVGMVDGEPKELGALALRCNFKPIVQKDKTKAS